MTRFRCPDCGGMMFGLTGKRLSTRVSATCTDCNTVVAEFHRADFTGGGEE